MSDLRLDHSKDALSRAFTIAWFFMVALGAMAYIFIPFHRQGPESFLFVSTLLTFVLMSLVALFVMMKVLGDLPGVTVAPLVPAGAIWVCLRLDGSDPAYPYVSVLASIGVAALAVAILLAMWGMLGERWPRFSPDVLIFSRRNPVAPESSSSEASRFFQFLFLVSVGSSLNMSAQGITSPWLMAALASSTLLAVICFGIGGVLSLPRKIRIGVSVLVPAAVLALCVYLDARNGSREFIKYFARAGLAPLLLLVFLFGGRHGGVLGKRRPPRF